MFHLEKGQIKSVPFQGGRVVEFQIGRLVKPESGEKTLRYTRSLGLVRSFYRLTLQFEADPEHTPYVFDVIKPDGGSSVEIRPESPNAKAVWAASPSPLYQDLFEAIAAVYALDIEGA